MIQIDDVHRHLAATYITCQNNTGGMTGICFRLAYNQSASVPVLSNLIVKNNQDNSGGQGAGKGIGIYAKANESEVLQLSVTDSTFEGMTGAQGVAI